MRKTESASYKILTKIIILMALCQRHPSPGRSLCELMALGDMVMCVVYPDRQGKATPKLIFLTTLRKQLPMLNNAKVKSRLWGNR